MKHQIKAALLAAGMLFAAEQAAAATLGLATEAPSLSSSTAIIDYLEFTPDGDLSTFGALVDFTDGLSPVGFTEIGFGVGFSLADPTTGATGGFDVFDENGLFLAGDLLSVGFTTDTIELQFDNLGGAAAGSFGASVLALIAFDDPLGPDPFATLSDGDSLSAAISIFSVAAAVPLPTGLPLLASVLGLGAVFGFARRGRDNFGARFYKLILAIKNRRTNWCIEVNIS